MKFATTLIAISLLSQTALSTSRAQATTTHPLLVDATLSESASFSLLLCEGKTATQCQPICGGTLIAPNLVATSRHCADVVPIESLDCNTYRFNGSLRDATTIWVTSAATIANASVFRRGLRWDVPLARTCGHDLALLTLESNMDAGTATRVPAVRDDAVAKVAASGAPLTVYGFGRTAPDAVADGTRREKEARVLCTGGRDACTSIPGGRELLPTEFAINTVVCPGDSGSGVFDADGALLGTLGRSIGGEKVCGNGVYIRLTPHTLLLTRSARAAHAQQMVGDASPYAYAYALPAWVEDAERLGNSTEMPPRAFGAPCDGPEDCASGECSSYDGGLAWSCVQPCGSDCQGMCRSSLKGGDRCFYEKLSNDEGHDAKSCACRSGAAVRSAKGSLELAVFVGMVIALRRRQRT